MKKVIIMGAAGRDFHNFNTNFRDNADYQVVAFTATQIPDIEGRMYPPELAGSLYPEGIPIKAESELEALIEEHGVNEVVFSYSDVPYSYVMNKSAIVNRAGASFRLMGLAETWVESTKPVVSICAVRTGCGKSQTTRRVAEVLIGRGKKVVAIRHPMPYGDLVKQRVQRFATYEDLDLHECTIEEKEEYEPHIDSGVIVYAGVDYEAILREAEKEADVILWDGGNNDFSFYKPDIYITVLDPHRPGHETSYYPGEVNLRAADVLVVNKIDSAEKDKIDQVVETAKRINPNATIIMAESLLTVEDPTLIKDKRVLVVEDGPTLTHGEMKYGAGTVAAQRNGAAAIIDPRPYLIGTIADTFEKYPHIGILLPAMGYSGQQVQDLEDTINATPCDAVVIGTPIDLRRVCNIKRPSTRVMYDLKEVGDITLEDVLKDI
ncbi:MAG: GTPase [Candidatus Aminicenantes bacterium]|nr:GTPase [Candidatus Aminicenantes bacterium]